MRIRFPDVGSDKLDALIADAEARRGKGTVSRSAWLQGAVRAAADDDDVASRIAAAIPDTGHGGARPGAGRPKRPGAPDARSIPERGVRRHETTVERGPGTPDLP